MTGRSRQKLIRFRMTAHHRAATIRRARDLRKQPTRSERILWEALRKMRLGAKFRRQQWIGPFIVDFYAPAARLAIEVDGPVHALNAECDRERQAVLESLGVRFVRVSADAVLMNLEGVLAAIAGGLKPPFPA
jgi:very-short-patch-repair endonuclease